MAEPLSRGDTNSICQSSDIKIDNFLLLKQPYSEYPITFLIKNKNTAGLAKQNAFFINQSDQVKKTLSFS